MSAYTTLRSVHLLLASIGLPFLVMYGVSAVQMSHSAWFDMKPSVSERRVPLTPGQTDVRLIARELLERDARVRGELTIVQTNATGAAFRLVLPGTVHEVEYSKDTGDARLKSSVAGTMGMLNRLHHAAGIAYEVMPLRLWGIAVAAVSAALLMVGATGVCMWFIRRSERRSGLVLLAINLTFAIVVLTLMRLQGP
jgi:hypothetical protein